MREAPDRAVRGRARPLPVQVDGDYIGDHEALVFESHPGALTVVA